ncbi:hypothetical protein PUNSTDRAFT_110583 [Punctularia strigosozonata HHB-11173 SS5]|uniref:uncharacterized protein n=1 Tax=Punctularia strigosozonata (strain HHB-11173) TaxID=741275 RepID=UPI000441663E|nr:uncharacterized protein PUNSTDRAFT_110583 [Punctularia strigosozonata HHB-11173 SS5]EIN14502.1 hypothetical protein PUNSTDRAFT_110583 [Punctularia strigosozonata HHB-11173 SS5]
MSKVVFVGNVPYNMGEDQLIDVFKSVGEVIGFRLVFDRETGKAKGYGFCEFADHETAMSAVRNLNNVDVGGRPLRIDLADSDPFLEGKTTVRGEIIDGGETRAQWRERERERDDRDKSTGSFASSTGGLSRTDSNTSIGGLPPGIPVPPGITAEDMITENLAHIPPDQLMEVLAQMKAFIITHPDQARQLLVSNPQLAYALFEALLLNNIVDQEILNVMLAASVRSRGSAPPSVASPYTQPLPYQQPAPSIPYTQPAVQPTQHVQPQPPMLPTSGAPYAQPPVVPPYTAYRSAPPSVPAPPQTPTQTATLPVQDYGDPAQRDMLMRILSLTPEQISSLPQQERDGIQQIRNQVKSLGSIPV